MYMYTERHCIHTCTSTFTQKYVKYMYVWKIILFMIEAHNMMYYSILQHSLLDENSTTLKKTPLKSPFQKFAQII